MHAACLCSGWSSPYKSRPSQDRSSLFLFLQHFIKAVRLHSIHDQLTTSILQRCIFYSHLKLYRSLLLNVLFLDDAHRLSGVERSLIQDWLTTEYQYVPLRIDSTLQKQQHVYVFTGALNQTRIRGKVATETLRPVKQHEVQSLALLNNDINALERLAGHENIVEILAFQRNKNKPVYYMTRYPLRPEHSDLFTYLRHQRQHHETIDLYSLVGFAIDICSAARACLDKQLLPLQLLLENFTVCVSESGRPLLRLQDFELCQEQPPDDQPAYIGQYVSCVLHTNSSTFSGAHTLFLPPT